MSTKIDTGGLSRVKTQVSADGMISVVVPVRDEEGNIEEFCRRVTTALDETGSPWEVIFVEDSSTDRTVNLINGICGEDSRFGAVFLTRSFGHHEAITAGISFTRGDRIITMDGDLQHPPEFIPTLLDHFQQGYDMVYAQRRGKEPFMKQIGSAFVNWMMRFLSDYPVDLNSSIYRIFSRQVADTLLAMPERRRFITGLLGWTGFNSKQLMFDEAPRRRGETKYSFRRMAEHGLGAITSFTVKPLRLGIHIGFFCSGGSLLITAYYIIKYLLVGAPVEGFTTVVAAIFFMGGLILLVLGIIGEYIGTIFVEIKERPLYLVRGTLNVDSRKQ